MKDNGISAYFITGTDPHQSEYVAPRWRTRAFISGFTGSAGTVIVTMDRALLWVDSRYYLQAAKEIEGTGYEMMKVEQSSPLDWMEENLPSETVLGIEERSISIRSFTDMADRFKRRGIIVRATGDLLTSIWKSRPASPFSHLRAVDIAYAGLTSEDKLIKVRSELERKGADYTFIAAMDDIAWITNLRGDDIRYNPVFLSFLFIDGKRAVLFAEKERFSEELLSIVEKDFEIMDYSCAYDALSKLAHGSAYYNPEKVNMGFAEVLDRESSMTGLDITTSLKARKNAIELRGMRRAHKMDGIAFANFMSKLSTNPDGSLSEMDVSDAFEAERMKMEGYLGPSFAPISGFAENGAIVHYSATKESNRRIDKDGLLVLDTGAQFYYGMTDLTRTLLFGKATQEQKNDYTLVLKGHLALASQRFIEGTRGYQLDILAHQYLWTAGMTYSHGTGHGVGCNLNVHEGPMRISPSPIDVPLEEGMVLSDEPGVYKEGKHGIRIENLVAVEKDVITSFGQFYAFEVLSLIPYEKKLIEVRLLSDNEINLINAYHNWVRTELIDEVDEGAKDWLEEATSPISRE